MDHGRAGQRDRLVGGFYPLRRWKRSARLPANLVLCRLPMSGLPRPGLRIQRAWRMRRGVQRLAGVGPLFLGRHGCCRVPSLRASSRASNHLRRRRAVAPWRWVSARLTIIAMLCSVHVFVVIAHLARHRLISGLLGHSADNMHRAQKIPAKVVSPYIAPLAIG